MPTNKTYILIGKLLGEIVSGAPLRGLPNNGITTDNPQVMQELTTAYITTMYYSALSNLYLQSILPDDIAEVDAQMPRFKIAFSRTYADFTTAANWLAKNGGEFIATSPAKQYYDELLAMEEGSIMDISAFYQKS